MELEIYRFVYSLALAPYHGVYPEHPSPEEIFFLTKLSEVLYFSE